MMRSFGLKVVARGGIKIGLKRFKAAHFQVLDRLEMKHDNLNHVLNRKQTFSTNAEPAQDDFFQSRTDYYLPFKYRRKANRDRYQLGKELGRGMFAVVYEAIDTVEGVNVAVKVMDKRTTPRSLFEQEFKILEEVSDKVCHNRITPIMDVYEDKNHLYFVLELMRGGDFFDHVAKNGRMPEQEAAIVVRKLCYALQALHRHGILHRDIKLENLLMNQKQEECEQEEDEDDHTGSFKLADFGFANRIGEKDKFKNPAGTIGYAAPEVLRSREYGPECDVWSAGVVLYILLAGHPPFPHKPDVDMSKLSIEEQLEAELEAIQFGRDKTRWNNHMQSGAWTNISPGAKKLVSKMLRLDPAKRYDTNQVLSDPWIVANTKLKQYEFLNFE